MKFSTSGKMALARADADSAMSFFATLVILKVISLEDFIESMVDLEDLVWEKNGSTDSIDRLCEIVWKLTGGDKTL